MLHHLARFCCTPAKAISRAGKYLDVNVWACLKTVAFKTIQLWHCCTVKEVMCHDVSEVNWWANSVRSAQGGTRNAVWRNLQKFGYSRANFVTARKRNSVE